MIQNPYNIPSSKTRRKNNLEENENTFATYYNKLFEISLVQFEWENVPDTISTRYLEICLRSFGMAVGFKNKDNDALLMLQVVNQGGLNMYWDLVKYDAFSINFRQSCDIENSVICYNNLTRTPTTHTICHFAKRLADIQRTIDVRLKHHKMPMMYRATKKTVYSIKRLINSILDNKVDIVIDDSMEGYEGNLTTVPTQIPYIEDKLEAQKKTIWNEAMLFLGVDNAQQDKAERMIVGEVESNNEQIALSRDSELQARKDFCIRFNKMFGTNIDVKYRRNKENLEEIEELKEGDANADA